MWKQEIREKKRQDSPFRPWVAQAVMVGLPHPGTGSQEAGGERRAITGSPKPRAQAGPCADRSTDTSLSTIINTHSPQESNANLQVHNASDAYCFSFLLPKCRRTHTLTKRCASSGYSQFYSFLHKPFQLVPNSKIKKLRDSCSPKILLLSTQVDVLKNKNSW